MWFRIAISHLLPNLETRLDTEKLLSVYHFNIKGTKIVNGGSDAQDPNQSQQNGDSMEDKREKLDGGTKKKITGDGRDQDKTKASTPENE